MKTDVNDIEDAELHSLIKSATPVSFKKLPPENTPSSAGMEFRRLSDVKLQDVEWLWKDRIPAGKVSLIPGDPGLGKSFVTLDFAARVSTGTAWPDGAPNEVGNVIVMNAEDDAADTILPRLNAMQADTSRIYIIDAVRDEDAKRRGFSLESDIGRLGDVLKQIGGARLILIDPLSAYLGTTDSHNNCEVRGLLAPVGELAGQHGVAIVAVTHLNKATGTKAIYRASGSLAFAAAARAVWSVVKDTEDPARRLFLPVKQNLSRCAGGLAYRIEGDPARIEWEDGRVDMDADEHMEHENHLSKQQGRSRCDAAGAWLRELLKGGGKEVGEIEQDAKAAGFSWSTVKRAKDEIGVKAVKTLGFGGKGPWRWELNT